MGFWTRVRLPSGPLKSKWDVYPFCRHEDAGKMLLSAVTMDGEEDDCFLRFGVSTIFQKFGQNSFRIFGKIFCAG